MTNEFLNQIYAWPFWTVEIFGNTIADYGYALVVLGAFLLLFKLVQVVILKYLQKLSQKTETDIDDTLVEIVGSIRPPFYSFLAFYLALFFLDIHIIVQKVINAVLIFWIVYQVITAIQILINYIVRKHFSPEEPGNQAIVSFLTGLIKGALWAMGLLMILSNLGVNITSLIAGLGIGGLAIAFALQKILGDLFSSFAIYFDKPFEVGDFIKAGEHLGTVEKIGIKTTRLRALPGEEIVISNQELTSSRIQNYGKMEERRIVFTLGATYETPTEKLKKIPEMIQKIIEGSQNVRFDRVHFKSYGDSALNFEVVYYVLSGDYAEYMDIQQDINFKIKEAFEKEGIDFAYPTQTLYLQK